MRCKRVMLASVVLGFSAAAAAQYRCVGAGGAVSYQQTPCAPGQQGDKVTIKPAAGAAPSPSAAVSSPMTAGQREARWVQTMEQDRKRLAIEREIQELSDRISARTAAMDAEVEALRSKKTMARNNLAGATWEQSISTEMQAVMARTATANDADQSRITRLRAELDRLRTQP